MSERPMTQRELLARVDERVCHIQKLLADHIGQHRSITATLISLAGAVFLSLVGVVFNLTTRK